MAGDYTDIATVRAQGFSSTSTYPDALIQAHITRWSQFIDKATAQWFESRALTAYFDGTDSDTLFLPVPIIAVTALYINGAQGVWGAASVVNTEYLAYNGNALPDDRKNPRIKLVGSITGSCGAGGIFAPGGRANYRPAFVRGRKNQKVVGTFGYVEPDGSTPSLIKWACIRLVCGRLRDGAGLLGSAAVGSTVKSETTDGHTITYSDASIFKQGKPGWSNITKDAEVDDILRMFRSPLKIAVPMSMDIERG